MRLSSDAARVAVTLAWLLTRAALAAAQGEAPPPPRPASSSPGSVAPSQDAAPAAQRPAPPSLLGRWLDVQQASLNLRYREQETSEGVVSNNQLQHQQQFRFRIKLDPAARYTVHFGAFTGNGFASGWNNTGLGTGEATGYLVLKQLFLAVEPIAGVEVQAGGLYPWRGESTEITTYDNDAYVTGVRASVRRPARLFFNEVTYTHANLDATARPNVFRRFDRFEDLNYRQIGVMRAIGRRALSSFDFTTHNGVRTLRAAARLRAPELRVVDAMLLEVYNRVNGANPAGGFAVSLDKAMFGNALALNGGFSAIDRRYAPSNGDRYLQGNHLFGRATWTLSREWTLQGFVARAVRTDYTIATGTRVDVLLQYNLIPALRRLNLVR
jgi:hypothetical protein